MVFIILFVVITVLLPLAICFATRNVKTLAFCFIVPIAVVAMQNRLVCHSDPYSEACTWAYLNYLIALPVALALYLVLTFFQRFIGYLQQRNQKQ